MKKNKMSRLCILGILVLLLCCISTSGFADTPALCADAVFGSATVYLSASKLAVFDCTLYDVHNCITVTNVWLEQEVDGDWEYVKALTPPTYVARNMADYVTEVSYSADITGSGTFRIGFTVDADGYAISRYSNSRTF